MKQNRNILGKGKDLKKEEKEIVTVLKLLTERLDILICETQITNLHLSEMTNEKFNKRDLE